MDFWKAVNSALLETGAFTSSCVLGQIYYPARSTGHKCWMWKINENRNGAFWRRGLNVSKSALEDFGGFRKAPSQNTQGVRIEVSAMTLFGFPPKVWMITDYSMICSTGCLSIIMRKKDDYNEKNSPFISLNVNEKRRLFGCPDFVSFTEKLLMGINFF